MPPLWVRVDLGAMAMKGYSVGGILYLCWGCSWCVLQPQPTGLPRHSLGRSYSSAEVQLVYSTAPVDWAIGHSLEKSYPSAEVQSVCSTDSADWAIGNSLGESHPSAEVQSVCSIALADWVTGHLLGESYLSAEVQSVYPTTPADWATKITLTPLNFFS